MHIDRLAWFAIIGVLAASLVSACSSERQIASAALASCVDCHGGLENQTGAPPYDANGDVDGPAVGAHTHHLDEHGVACESCHVVPDRVGGNHPDGRRAEVTFGGLALAGSAEDRARTGPPQYDPVTLTCSAVYCHGGTLDAGGTNTAPSWGQVLPACGTCHSYPPPSHVNYLNQGLTCSVCHAKSIEADDFTLKATHLDGKLDFDF
jgi:predicted CxxxxCH...CXXCH cytochrome family protein